MHVLKFYCKLTVFKQVQFHLIHTCFGHSASTTILTLCMEPPCKSDVYYHMSSGGCAAISQTAKIQTEHYPTRDTNTLDHCYTILMDTHHSVPKFLSPDLHA